MRVNPEQLPGHLSRELAPVYLVYGDEPLQIREALDAIRGTARARGFVERQVFDAERGFDWASLRGEADSLSLFAAQRLLEVRIPTGKPGEAGARALREYAQNPPPEILLLVSVGKLEASAQRSAWVNALDGAGVVVQARPLDRRRLASWVQRRAAGVGVELSDEAASLLADRGEGNMLACAQEIDKLGLLYGPGSVNLQEALAAVFDNARYTLFALVDSALGGDTGRSVRILAGLQAEGIDPVLISWALGRELRQLCSMAHDLARGASLGKVLATHKVWESRKGLCGAALRRHKPAHLRDLLRGLGKIDAIIKGASAGDAWIELTRLCLRLAAPRGAQRTLELQSTV